MGKELSSDVAPEEAQVGANHHFRTHTQMRWLFPIRVGGVVVSFRWECVEGGTG